MNQPSVTAACLGNTVWIRVEGRGTFHISSGMKDFSINMIRKGYREFVVDLGQCELMDSTFMGTLAGLALRLKEIGQGHLQVIQPNSRNAMLLENLGLDQLFVVRKLGDPDTPQLPEGALMVKATRPASDPEEARQTALSAHEALVEADASNESRFRDVLDYLKQESSVGDSES